MAASFDDGEKPEKTWSDTSHQEYTTQPEPKTPGVVEAIIFTKSNQHRTFDSDSDNSFYAPIDSFEGRHRWDPEFQWTEKEEKRLVRKVCFSSSLEKKFLETTVLSKF